MSAITWYIVTGILVIVIAVYFILYKLRKDDQEDEQSPIMDGAAAAMLLLLKERLRQMTTENHLPLDDDKYRNDELAFAAADYLRIPKYPFNVSAGQLPPNGWPLVNTAWKPQGGRLRQLVKAGALVLAEIEREQRKQALMEDAERLLDKHKNFVREDRV